MTVEVEYYRNICTNGLCSDEICVYDYDPEMCEYYAPFRRYDRRVIPHPCGHRERRKIIKVKNTNNVEYFEGSHLRLGKEVIYFEDIAHLKIGNKVEVDEGRELYE